MALAEMFVGPDLAQAITVLRRLQIMMDNRYAYLLSIGRRKIVRGDRFWPYLVAIDEIAFFSATVGKKQDREDFSALLRDLVARGRAVGIIVVAATQRPSSDIIPTSLRDLFGYRWAFRCTTPASSDVILGHGWAGRGYSATDIDPAARGVSWLLAEGGIPRRMRAAYLDDDQVRELAERAARLRADLRAEGGEAL
jgi:S-DNA-T family DNA segregation ATPase FtsK/SpoIIIE